ncbi:MAG TPA: apolipoprotein N-acyltransferase [Myxococcota bacterium]|nr:apolipoprotein N-acyltransferase [Myxococcota bacterium]
MESGRVMPWRWILAYVAATFFAFPQPVGDAFVLDLGLVLAPVAPALLLVALRGLAPGRALRVGFVAGWLAHAALLHWGYVVTVAYGHAPVIAGVLAPFGMALYPAAFIAGFAAVAALLAKRGLANPFLLAAAWVTFEWLRSWVLTGFTWGGIGYAWHQSFSVPISLASLTGVSGLAFAAAAAGFACIAARARWASRLALAFVGAHLAASLVYAAFSRGETAEASSRSHPRYTRVAALQGNIDQNAKWTPEAFEETLRAYEDLTRRAAAEGAQLIAWPETAVPAPLAIPELRDRIAALAREVRTPLIVGAIGVDFDAQGRPIAHYDSAFVFSYEGELLDRYDKTHLVPFGEYLPLRPLLGRFIRAIATGSIANDVSAGARVRATDVPLANGETIRVGIPICYELIFPDLVRRFADDGAQLLVGITNDAWYGRTGSPYQFLAMTELRSAETRLPGVRAANTGVSALIGKDGHAFRQTRIFERDWVVGDVELLAAPTRTLYSRYGDWFAHACTVATVLASSFAIFRGRKQT